MRIGSKLVLILFLFPFTCLAQVKGKVVSVSDSTSTPSANFSLEKELKDVVVVADMVSRNASKETIFITDSLRKGTVSAIQLLAKLPGITTDWGTDEVNVGKDKNVPIVINGKEVKREYAISLNPKRIKKVEIMRYPAGK